MSGDVSDKKRLISITKGNLGNNHIYLSGHHDFFPGQCYGKSDKKKGIGKELILIVEGLNGPVKTDIGINGSNGKPRNFFRNRKWVRMFFKKHEIREGDVVAIERVDKFTYRIYPFESKNVREGAVVPDHWTEINTKKLTVIDLFAGCGGLSHGFIQAGYEIVLAIDNDPTALKTFEFNHSSIRTLLLDLSAKNILNKIKKRLTSSKVEVIIGGPPCQGFSLTGPRNFHDRRNRLYLSFLGIVFYLKPDAFLIENVPGIATLYNGKIKEKIISLGDKHDYNVKADCLLACDYGVPQMRRRHFFVGIRKSFGSFEFPKTTHSSKNYITCSDAISDLPNRENEIGKEEDIYNCPPITEYQRIMRNGNGILYNHVATNHTQKVVDVIKLVREGKNYKDLPAGVGEHRKFHEAWTRYHSQKPSRTIDTGHRNHFHYKYNRVPTIRENARLQSFPDNFIFIGSKTQQNRHVGNAVPPILAYHLAKKLMEYLT